MLLDQCDVGFEYGVSGAEKSRGERPAAVVLDLPHLRKYTLGIADLEREILGLFVGELPKSRAALMAAESGGAWHMAAHTLKGSALAIGAKRLAACGAKAEATDCTDDTARAAVIAEIGAAIAEVENEIARLGLV